MTARASRSTGYDARLDAALDVSLQDAEGRLVAASVIGTQALLKALPSALLEPADRRCALEGAGNYAARLAGPEDVETLPARAVWNYHWGKHGVPIWMAWMDEMRG